MGERVRAKKLLRSVSQGMLLMWDRGLHSYVMVMETLSQGADYLGLAEKVFKLDLSKSDVIQSISFTSRIQSSYNISSSH